MKSGVRKKKKKIFALLILLGITIGYALISTTLNINGIAGIKSNRWDIHWDDESIQVADGSVSPKSSAVVTDSKKTIVDFSVEFEMPGDYYEFYIDAVNEGTIDGQISLIKEYTYAADGQTTVTLPSYIKYSVVYADNEEKPAVGDILEKDGTRTYKVRVEYDEESETLPSSNETYKFSVQVTYSQISGSNGNGEGSSGEGKGPGATKIVEKVDDSDPKEPKNFQEPETPTKPEETVQRYTGADPNNYIYFNCDSLEAQNSNTCEIWRIISEDDNRLRIIRNDSIGNKKWTDTEFETLYEGPWGPIYTDINRWDESTLQEYLNGTYYNSLSTVSKKLIATETWYVNGYSTIKANTRWRDFYDEYAYYFTDPMFAKTAYLNERTPFNSATSHWQTDTFVGKVGLMYASDYGYASSACDKGCVTADEGDCNVNVSNAAYSLISPGGEANYSESVCTSSNWLYKGASEWVINPYLETVEGGQGMAMFINNIGSMSWTTANARSYGVRPVVYLKAGIDLEGTGASTDPYKIKATDTVLNTDDTGNGSGGGTSSGSGSNTNTGPTPSAQGSGSNQSCTDTTKPTCTLNYVTTTSIGFKYSFSCTDDVEMNRITSLFDHDPYHGQYDSTTFERIGSVKNGIKVNGGATHSYSSRWTTANPPSRSTCYYFSYGGEDKCGNWVVYHTPTCYQY